MGWVGFGWFLEILDFRVSFIWERLMTDDLQWSRLTFRMDRFWTREVFWLEYVWCCRFLSFSRSLERSKPLVTNSKSDQRESIFSLSQVFSEFPELISCCRSSITSLHLERRSSFDVGMSIEVGSSSRAVVGESGSDFRVGDGGVAPRILGDRDEIASSGDCCPENVCGANVEYCRIRSVEGGSILILNF